MNDALLIILVCGAITLLSRYLPFLIFPEHKETPDLIKYLSTYLPVAIMGLLVVYSVKDINFLKSSVMIPEVAGIISVIGFHLLKKNTLLSIIGGTAVYMLVLSLC